MTHLIANLNSLTIKSQDNKFPVSKNSIAYKLVRQGIENPGTLIRTCHISGRGRFSSNQDHHYATTTLLRKLGISFTEGNDSPRGGKVGQFVIVNA